MMIGMMKRKRMRTNVILLSGSCLVSLVWEGDGQKKRIMIGAEIAVRGRVWKMVTMMKGSTVAGRGKLGMWMGNVVVFGLLGGG
jgi:hypothetical protein